MARAAPVRPSAATTVADRAANIAADLFIDSNVILFSLKIA
jgi:hypothetical protein